MPRRNDRRTLGQDEDLVDMETLRSCFDEGCNLVIDGDGRMMTPDGEEDPSLQTLSKLRRWY